MNSENSKTSEPHVLILKLTEKLDLKKDEKSVALSNLSIDYKWKNTKSSYNNNKFKISAPTWSDKFELPDELYSVSGIQHCFEYILKTHGENTDNPSVRRYVNKIENRITFKIKTGYYLQLLTPETMKLHRSTKNEITKDKNSENVQDLVNNNYQQDSRVLPFGSLLEISSTNFILLKIFNSEFQVNEVWFTD